MFFTDLWLAWFLVPLFALWLGAWTYLRRKAAAGRGDAALVFSSLQRLKHLKPSPAQRLRHLVVRLRVITVALLLVAMVRPQTGRKQTVVHTEGIDIMLAIDTSGSMNALDLDADRRIQDRRNRLEVVKSVVENFIERRPRDQIGMVVFGEHAFTQCPLTLDHGILSTFLDRLEIGMAGDSTALGSAVGTAVKRLKKAAGKSQVLILLTDGRNNAGSLSPKKAAEVAKTFGIKIYTIAAGTRGKAPFLVENLFGKQVVYDDLQIDEASLKEMAEITGGAYFRAEDAKGLADIYDHIDELETTDIEMTSYMEYNERFSWFVFPAMALLLAEILALGTRLRKIP